jgi:hypothetical protein
VAGPPFWPPDRLPVTLVAEPATLPTLGTAPAALPRSGMAPESELRPDMALEAPEACGALAVRASYSPKYPPRDGSTRTVSSRRS